HIDLLSFPTRRSSDLMPTLEAVFNKLNQPLPLGYCNVGTVVAVGKGVSEFQVGDRVASNGNHAEFVSVPKNLVAKVPDNVCDERSEEHTSELQSRENI